MSPKLCDCPNIFILVQTRVPPISRKLSKSGTNLLVIPCSDLVG